MLPVTAHTRTEKATESHTVTSELLPPVASCPVSAGSQVVPSLLQDLPQPQWICNRWLPRMCPLLANHPFALNIEVKAVHIFPLKVVSLLN